LDFKNLTVQEFKELDDSEIKKLKEEYCHYLEKENNELEKFKQNLN